MSSQPQPLEGKVSHIRLIDVSSVGHDTLAVPYKHDMVTVNHFSADS
jgi:hypothetical protein